MNYVSRLHEIEMPTLEDAKEQAQMAWVEWLIYEKINNRINNNHFKIK